MDKKSIAPTFFTAANCMNHQIVMSVALLDKNSKSQENILIHSTYWCCEIIQDSQAALEAISRYQASGYLCLKQRALKAVRIYNGFMWQAFKVSRASHLDLSVKTVAALLLTLMGTYITYMYISPHYNFSSEFLVSWPFGLTDGAY